ncbi:hypothetical protein [Microbulbifer magnicolonia]|uniref:hypothetical protein n=1 Tax=Microbulbifer magnicolonia TaxID=3109744 RepID=UPI002B400703|nr:hypothetical protein [Microbulbifer sp. GG15]
MPYKIYAAEIKRVGQPGIIITTAYKNAGGYPRAESFFIVPQQDAHNKFNKLTFDVQSFESSPVTLDEEFMLKEALNQAQIDLALFIETYYEKCPQLIPPNVPNTTESNINLLVHTWVRGAGDSLKDVYQKTEYEPLREALRPIIPLPTMERSSL